MLLALGAAFSCAGRHKTMFTNRLITNFYNELDNELQIDKEKVGVGDRCQIC